MTLPPTSPHAIVWCGDTPVLQSPDDGSVITSMSSPHPADTVSIVPLAGRSIAALISRFVAARSLRSCALAFAPPAFSMFYVRTLPCVAILKLASAARAIPPMHCVPAAPLPLLPVILALLP